MLHVGGRTPAWTEEHQQDWKNPIPPIANF
jgi:hypothetical protein